MTVSDSTRSDTRATSTTAPMLGPGGRAFTGAAIPMDLGWTAR